MTPKQNWKEKSPRNIDELEKNKQKEDGLVFWHFNHHRLSILDIYICEHKSRKLNSCKYCNVSLTIQLNIIRVYTQLNDQTVLFLIIQFSISQQSLHGSKYCYVSLTIQLNIIRLHTVK